MQIAKKHYNILDKAERCGCRPVELGECVSLIFDDYKRVGIVVGYKHIILSKEQARVLARRINDTLEVFGR